MPQWVSKANGSAVLESAPRSDDDGDSEVVEGVADFGEDSAEAQAASPVTAATTISPTRFIHVSSLTGSAIVCLLQREPHFRARRS